MDMEYDAHEIGRSISTLMSNQVRALIGWDCIKGHLSKPNMTDYSCRLSTMFATMLKKRGTYSMASTSFLAM